MKKINQKNPTDCGICCIAMLLDIDYNEALEIAKPYMNNDCSIDFEKLQDCLIENACAIRVSEGMPDKKSKDGILEIKLPNGNFHYVVWDSKNKKIIDPQAVEAKEFVPLRFIEVERL